MTDFYNPEQRNWQDRYGTRRLADLEVQVIVHDTITAEDKTFIEARDMFFLSTVDERGWPTCSYKGGSPGFVRVLDGKTIAFPAFNGNGMYLSLGNVSANNRVGMLFIELEKPHRLRLHGRRRRQRRGSAARGVSRGGTDRARDGREHVHQLPALHPQDEEDGAIRLRAEPGLPDARAGLEEDTGSARGARKRRNGKHTSRIPYRASRGEKAHAVKVIGFPDGIARY
jgi:hypothetical protein